MIKRIDLTGSYWEEDWIAIDDEWFNNILDDYCIKKRTMGYFPSPFIIDFLFYFFFYFFYFIIFGINISYLINY
ncbi:hypothetical protein [Granulicatella balaenopterae]|nr:hypothetical protein [Granulicatella balaenopterae]